MARKRSLFDRALVAMMPLVPKSVVKRIAKRYVAGETLEEAITRCRELNAQGAMVTIDVLGEEIENIEAGAATRDAYFAVLDALQRERIDGNASVKLTAFGLKIDPEICFERLRAVVEHARDLDNFVRIDMEDSEVTTATLDQYRRLRTEGFNNTGVVLQAYMRRSQKDVADLAHHRPSYRLCKGIYVEPEKVAFQDGAAINRNYLTLLEDMLARGSYVGIATHDHRLVDAAFEMVA
ncbi:MAG: proline dehydrogenase family protein, partial [Planctomycetes bacterium]|nr:proline dehydrogenase family protein [Planctomycetota bacterium]